MPEFFFTGTNSAYRMCVKLDLYLLDMLFTLLLTFF